MKSGRWPVTDNQWWTGKKGWQMAGEVDLMIPPGTAVRDAHACYEVVVPVTVPDKPRLAPSSLNYHYSPHGRPTRAMHTGADTNELPLRGELLEDTVYYDRQGGRINIMNETPLDEELLETKSTLSKNFRE
jgi:hypothetical protein